MTDTRVRKKKNLAREILVVLVACSIVTAFLYMLLKTCALVIIEGYLTAREIVLTDLQYIELDGWVYNVSLVVSAIFFLILFLFLLGERLSYIQESLKGIEALYEGNLDYVVPVEGDNELTHLAESINYLSKTQRTIKEKEKALNEEKEQFIRTLSHDIRTPLTSIMAYSEFLTHSEQLSEETKTEYLELIQKKAEQIKDLTDILLDGGKRHLEYFDNVSLLMTQLVDEFEDYLQDISVTTQIETDGKYEGMLDVHDLQRIFDNLASNIEKYADVDKEITLTIRVQEHKILICQKNYVKKIEEPVQSYQIGLNSIRRIAHNYGGQVEVRQEDSVFEIQITLLDT